MTPLKESRLNYIEKTILEDVDAPRCLIRLVQVIRECADGKISAFSNGLGLSKSAITNQLSQRRPVTQVLALAIEGKHRINHKWLLTGSGEMRIIAPVVIDPQIYEQTITTIDRLNTFLSEANVK